jgi:hypothetical protein
MRKRKRPGELGGPRRLRRFSLRQVWDSLSQHEASGARVKIAPAKLRAGARNCLVVGNSYASLQALRINAKSAVSLFYGRQFSIL